MKTSVVVVAIALLADLAVGLVLLGATLGAVAFIVWFQNRDNLRALDQLLREKAEAGLAVLDAHKPTADGA